MKPFWLIILVLSIVFIVGGLIYAYDIHITSEQIYFILFLFLMGSAIFLFYHFRYLFRKQKEDTTIEKAWEYVTKFWKEKTGENLTWLENCWDIKYSYGKKHVCFYTNRQYVDSTKPGMPVIIIVCTEPLSIVHINDNPSVEDLEDPWAKFARGHPLSPTKDIIPEYNLWYWRQKREITGSSVNVNIGREKDEWDEFVGKKKKE